MTCTFFRVLGLHVGADWCLGRKHQFPVGRWTGLITTLHHLTLCPEPTVIVRKRKGTSEVFAALCTTCLNWVPLEAGEQGFKCKHFLWKKDFLSSFFGRKSFFLLKASAEAWGVGREAKRDQAGCNDEQVILEQAGLWGRTLRGRVEEILKLKHYQNHLEGL